MEQAINHILKNTYIHICIHVQAHTHTHIPKYLHTYIHAVTYMHTHTYIHILAQTHTYIRTYMQSHTAHTYLHTQLHAQTHTYIHTQTHINTYIHAANDTSQNPEPLAQRHTIALLQSRNPGSSYYALLTCGGGWSSDIQIHYYRLRHLKSA
jgi:hypothetical protein